MTVVSEWIHWQTQKQLGTLLKCIYHTSQGSSFDLLMPAIQFILQGVLRILQGSSAPKLALQSSSITRRVLGRVLQLVLRLVLRF